MPQTLKPAGKPVTAHPGEEEFRRAVGEVESGMAGQHQLRPDLTFEEEPSPRRLAPHAHAIAATVVAGDEGDNEVGWGKFVLLFDGAGQAGWDGKYRIIGYVRAELEPEMAADPLINEVGWSWLTEALDARSTGYRMISGTVTTVVTQGFGSKQDEPMSTEFELRASWSPDDLRRQLGRAGRSRCGLVRRDLRSRRAAAIGTGGRGAAAAAPQATGMTAQPAGDDVHRRGRRAAARPQAERQPDAQADQPDPQATDGQSEAQVERQPDPQATDGRPRRTPTRRPIRRPNGTSSSCSSRAMACRRLSPAPRTWPTRPQHSPLASGRSRSTPSAPRASGTGTGRSSFSCGARVRGPC